MGTKVIEKKKVVSLTIDLQLASWKPGAAVRGTIGEDFEDRKATYYGTRAGFFTLSAIGVLGQLILCCWGLSSACRMFSSTSDLYLLDARSIPLLWQLILSSNIVKYLLGSKIPL